MIGQVFNRWHLSQITNWLISVTTFVTKEPVKGAVCTICWVQQALLTLELADAWSMLGGGRDSWGVALPGARGASGGPQPSLFPSSVSLSLSLSTIFCNYFFHIKPGRIRGGGRLISPLLAALSFSSCSLFFSSFSLLFLLLWLSYDMTHVWPHVCSRF